ncbi:hypothetical protein G9A89_016583 [Geosiphon pyriformis]|nr:hypothetical protein G9A89_016583 [Geosiphon pyriformis]
MEKTIIKSLSTKPLDKTISSKIPTLIISIEHQHADELASLAANFSLALSVLVKERFIKASGMAVSKNVCHFAHEIFRSVNCACWEVGLGFDVINDSLLGDVNWFFAVQKRLYSKVYSNVLCLHCSEVESSDYFFVCTFDSNARKSILRSYLAKWHCVFGLSLHLSYVSQVLSLYTSDNVLYITIGKGFVFRDWVQKALSILSDAKVVGRFIVDFVQDLGAAYYIDIWLVRAKYKALMEKDGLILFDGFVYSVTHGLSCMFSAGVIRLLGIAKTVGVCFGFHKHCCFFSGIDDMVSVLIDL